MRGTLSRQAVDLRCAIGPWKRTPLYRLGLAVHAAGEGETEDAAHKLVWQALELARSPATVSEALARVGLDVGAVALQLQWIDADWVERQGEEQRDQANRLARAGAWHV
jgi:hypothetical protein